MTQMIFPPPLHRGDTVGLAAPSSPVTGKERDESVRFLESMGYRVRPGRTLKNPVPDNLHGYLAGTVSDRAADINALFADDSVKAIFCIRGGYGSAGILCDLDYPTIRNHPKIFIGYSDITNLHTVLQKFCGLVTFHGPMVKPDMISGFDEYSRESLRAALEMGEWMTFENPRDNPFQILSEGTACGIITGGNLAVLARSCGTFYQPDAAGKILFLEDIGESVPSLHMYLIQMEESGLFDRAAGILLGDFTDCGNDRYDPSYDTAHFFRDWAAARRFPVMAGIHCGHGPQNGTIPLGATCIMDTVTGQILFQRPGIRPTDF